MLQRITQLSLLMLLAVFTLVAFAQQRTTSEGVYTEAQAEVGESVYDDSCRTCHDMQFYESIWDFWVDKPLLDFWFAIVAEMPTDNPGVLTDGEYTDIVAYILSEMGFPAGNAPLDRYNGLDTISISAP